MNYLEKKFKDGVRYVFVLEEKYGTKMYYVGSIEQLCKTALKILTRRLKEGWYVNPEKDKPEPPSLISQEIEKLPEGKIKDFAKKELQQYIDKNFRWQKELRNYKEIKEVVEKKLGEQAFIFLESRGSHEYEKCTLEMLMEIK